MGSFNGQGQVIRVANLSLLELDSGPTSGATCIMFFFQDSFMVNQQEGDYAIQLLHVHVSPYYQDDSNSCESI